MPKSKCIEHRKRERLLVLREDYLAICDGDHCAAAILSCFEYWHNWKLERAEEEKAKATANSGYIPETSLWTYKSIASIQADVLGLFGDRKIRDSLVSVLEAKGFLSRRKNPKFPMDNTQEYLFNADRIQDTLSAMSKLPVGPAKTQDGLCEKDRFNPAKLPDSYKEREVENTTREDTPLPPPEQEQSQPQNQEATSIDLDMSGNLEEFAKRTYRQVRGIRWQQVRKNWERAREPMERAEREHGEEVFRRGFHAFVSDDGNWLRDNIWPPLVFLKDPSEYLKPESVSRGTSRKPARAVAEPGHPVATGQGGATGSQPARADPAEGLLAIWAETNPDCPANWNPKRDPVGRLRKLAQDPEVVAQWPSVCEKVAQARKAQHGIPGWLPDFRWLLGTSDKGDNWWRVQNGALNWMLGNGKKHQAGGRGKVDTDAVTREALESLGVHT